MYATPKKALAQKTKKLQAHLDCLKGKVSTMTQYLEKVSEIERHFCEVGKACVLQAKNTAALKALLIAAVWDVDAFKTLPKKSQAYVQGFVQGAAELAAFLQDAEPDALVERHEDAELPPKEILDLQPGVGWKKHPNGGGWVSETAYVEASASVGGRAAVFGNARVLDRSRIYGSARVAGEAECFGAPHIHGRAVVGGHAKVYDAAKVLGDAQVYGYVEIGGTSVVRGTVVLDGNQIIIDDHVTDRDAARKSNAKDRSQVHSSRPA